MSKAYIIEFWYKIFKVRKSGPYPCSGDTMFSLLTTYQSFSVSISSPDKWG